MATPRKYQPYYLEEKASLHDEIDNPTTHVKRVVRFWPLDVGPFELQAIVAEMDEYSSSKNQNPQRYVDSPGVNRNAKDGGDFCLPGRWRVLVNRTHRPGSEKPGIYQELCKDYLQPPGTVGDYPPSKDASDWSGIDDQIRVVGIKAYSDANRLTGGKNLFYGVEIDNVATETATAFCEALANRGVLENPKLEKQIPLAGRFLFGGVQANQQEDGRSKVLATLAHADNFSNVANVFSDLWNERVARMFFDHLPLFPSQPFPPANVAAVDKGDYSGQVSPAIIYQIMDAVYSDDEGLWRIVVNKRVAKPFVLEWTVPSEEGAYKIIEYANQTAAWVQNKFTSLGSVLRNSTWRPPNHNEFGLFDGHIHQTVPKSTSGFQNWYDTGYVGELYVTFRHTAGDRYIKEVWQILCRYVFNQSVIQGQQEFHGIDGKDHGTVPLMEWSYFHPQGNDKYVFKKTVSVTLKTTDKTNAYDSASRAGPVTMADSTDFSP